MMVNTKALPKGTKHPEYGDQKRLFGYFQAIFLSFYSVDIYVDAKNRWKGFGAVYFLLMMAVVSIPLAVKIETQYYSYYKHVLSPALKKIPTLEIIKGELNYPESKPLLIRNPQTNSPLIIIDTSGNIIDLPNKKYPELSMLITKHAMVTQFGKMPPSTNKFENDMTFKVTYKMLEPMYEKLKQIFLFLFYPSMVMFGYGIVYTLLVVLAFILKMFSVILLKYEITFKQALRLGCLALTPPAFLSMIFTLLSIQGRTVSYSLFFLWAGYFIFAIRSNKFAAKYPLVV